MPVTVSARCVPRSDNAFPITFQASGLGNIYNWTLTIGDVTTDPPLDHGDFVSPFDFGWANMTDVQVLVAPAGTSLSITGLLTTTGAPGDPIYLALFRGLTPGPTDPVVALAGPFIIDAA